MAPVSESLRRTLEKTVVEARDIAEAGSRAALERVAVHRGQPFREMSPDERELRVRLRAHAVQLGDVRDEGGEQGTTRLVAECAYEHWHRMLFARFLAENRLLIHPEHGVPVTLAECDELAAAFGEIDGWALAGRFAARMLPAIFRPDDPVLSVRLAPEHQQGLEKLLAGLPAEVFSADDSLGWVYQFWQTKRKKEVNESGRKIGADELPAVTQLFTEPYMVQFLLHNTLGAWWAAKVLASRPELAEKAASEDELRRACALPGCEWNYLRFVRSEDGAPWRPAAGTFDGWPDRVAGITVLDPCCGSGHFVVEAFRILVAMRVAERSLSARDACNAVFRDNLFALEVDERCTQIAAFNLALAAWSYPGAGGYRPLPELHVACSGLAVGAKEEEWLKLAGGDERLGQGMRRLYRLFQDAPTLGSLIGPRREFEARAGELEFDKGQFERLQPLLEQALAREEVRRDQRATEAGIAARGMAKAALLLAGSYTLVSTNVPYLGRAKQSGVLMSFSEHIAEDAISDLATTFLHRLHELSESGGSIAVVLPQAFLALQRYAALRERLLRSYRWLLYAKLGDGAFSSISGAVVNVGLAIFGVSKPDTAASIHFIDLVTEDHSEKVIRLREHQLRKVGQLSQLRHPGARVSFEEPGAIPYLGALVDTHQGIATSDGPRFVRNLWEIPLPRKGWEYLQSAPAGTSEYRGREDIIFWEDGNGEITEVCQPGAPFRGQAAWFGEGVAVAQMSSLSGTLYTGQRFDGSAVVIIPKDKRHRDPLWHFVSSGEFEAAVRAIDSKLRVANATMAAVPFDLDRWVNVTEEAGPLPEPSSDDPTQWLFHGRPEAAAEPLQVAVARLLGYRWPAELDDKMRLSQQARDRVRRCDELLGLADDDGILCIPAVRGEQPAADRLQQLLARTYGAAWTPGSLQTLLELVEFSGKTLEDWLRNGFFEQHCQLFHQRPFVWHIWDGRRRDGFAALVNYHKLDRKPLERLTYTILGDWIKDQRKSVQDGERGAGDRLAAAEALQQRLALILEGEPPHDIFVRWKPLHRQPIGWEPDLNDGVRINIRPFVAADVLRKNPKIGWTKDRGAEPEGMRPKEQFPWFWKSSEFTGERVNDVHLSNMEKRSARERAVRMSARSTT